MKYLRGGGGLGGGEGKCFELKRVAVRHQTT